MLILRRRVGEKILVGGSVEIEIVEISKSRVKLGVRAPAHVPVVRKETATVAGENRTALSSNTFACSIENARRSTDRGTGVNGTGLPGSPR